MSDEIKALNKVYEVDDKLTVLRHSAFTVMNMTNTKDP